MIRYKARVGVCVAIGTGSSRRAHTQAKAGRVRHGPHVPLLFTPRAPLAILANFPLVAGPSPHPLRRSRRRKEACWTAHATRTEEDSQRESGGLAQTVAGSGGSGDVRGARGGASRRGVHVARMACVTGSFS